MPRRHKNTGFTLYELLATMTIAAIIASIAVPGFQNLMFSSRSVSHANDLITALNMARSEATRRRFPIDVCASSDGATCSGSTDWSTGWIIRTQAAEVLGAWPERSGGNGVLTGNVATIQFQSTGGLPAGVNPQLALQLPNCKDPGRRNITISPAGRIAVQTVNCI